MPDSGSSSGPFSGQPFALNARSLVVAGAPVPGCRSTCLSTHSKLNFFFWQKPHPFCRHPTLRAPYNLDLSLSHAVFDWKRPRQPALSSMSLKATIGATARTGVAAPTTGARACARAAVGTTRARAPRGGTVLEGAVVRRVVTPASTAAPVVSWAAVVRARAAATRAVPRAPVALARIGRRVVN